MCGGQESLPHWSSTSTSFEERKTNGPGTCFSHDFVEERTCARCLFLSRVLEKETIPTLLAQVPEGKLWISPNTMILLYFLILNLCPFNIFHMSHGHTTIIFAVSIFQVFHRHSITLLPFLSVLALPKASSSGFALIIASWTLGTVSLPVFSKCFTGPPAPRPAVFTCMHVQTTV